MLNVKLSVSVEGSLNQKERLATALLTSPLALPSLRPNSRHSSCSTSSHFSSRWIRTDSELRSSYSIYHHFFRYHLSNQALISEERRSSSRRSTYQIGRIRNHFPGTSLNFFNFNSSQMCFSFKGSLEKKESQRRFEQI